MKEKFAKLLNSQASIFSIRDWKDGMATSQGLLRDLKELIHAFTHMSHEPGTVHWKKKNQRIYSHKVYILVEIRR